jgi:CHAT domain-containing protein
MLWVIDRDGHDLVELPARAAIAAEVQRLRDAMARPGAGDDALRTSAYALYEMLLDPAGARLEGAGAVVIVPDGVLFELPFEALLCAPPDGEATWNHLDWFARHHTTTYAPSATVYLDIDRRRARKHNYVLDLLAVANPDFTGLDGLAPLPYAAEEVSAIGSLVDARRCVFLEGADATESELKRRMATGAPRVLHLATHGLVDPLEPTRSSIALAADGDNDGYLHTLEILSMPGDVGLVVMSACESARGKISRGEGVVGLSRAFLAAGAGAVVASLWAVSDQSTAELMKAMYAKMMGEKEPAGRALNEARLAMIDGGERAHPFYWSPFVVIGGSGAPWQEVHK